MFKIEGNVPGLRARSVHFVSHLPATAQVVTGEERDTLYAKQAAIMPNFAEYQQKNTRKIPVIVLERHKS